MMLKLLATHAALAAAVLLQGCASVDPMQVPIEPASASRELPTRSERTDDQRRAAIRLQLAVGYYEQRQFETALDELAKALQADPNLADAYSVRALTYMALGEKRLAEDNFARALQISPGNPEYLNNYGWFLCQNGQETKSIGIFEAALKNRSYQSPSKALNNAGVCSMRMKDWVRAENYLYQSFQAEPANLATNLLLADVYHQQKKDDKGRFYIQRVVRSDAVTPEALWLAIKIERRLGDKAAETSLATQLRRRYPNSPQYAAYQRGAYDE